MPKKKHPKVSERKLGRHKALGLAYKETNRIEIDPRQKGKEYFDTIIHEWMHLRYPNWSEKEVALESKTLTDFLWKNNVRIVRA